MNSLPHQSQVVRSISGSFCCGVSPTSNRIQPWPLHSSHSNSMTDLPVKRASLVQTTKPSDWISDEVVSDCMSCARPFTLINRKHHCRSCGHIICGTCSSHSLQLPSHSKPVRVCESCFTISRIESRGLYHDDLMTSLKSQCVVENDTVIRKAELLQSMNVIETSISNSSQLFESDVDDITRDRRAVEFNQLGQRAALILDELTSLRLKGGLFRCILVNKEFPDMRPSIVRLCLITPFVANNQTINNLPSLIAISSLIHQASNVNDPQSTSSKQLRWHTVRLMDEVQSTKLIDVTIGTTNHRAIQLSFKSSSINQSDPLVLAFIDESSRTALDSVFWQLFSLPNQPPVKTSLATREAEANFEWRSDIEMNMMVHTHLKQHSASEKVQLQVANQLESWIHESVDWNNPEHERLLQRVYQTFSLNPHPFPGRKHDEWKRIGFQSEDPVSDFRGMGRLSLECLVFAGEHSSDLIRQLVLVQPDRCYPLCATQINIVSACAEALALSRVKPNNAAAVNATTLYRIFARSARSTLPGNTQASVPVEKHLHLLVVVLMCWVDVEAVQTKADYMSMGTVLKSMKQALNDAISQDPASVDVLIEILNSKHTKSEPAVPLPVAELSEADVDSDTENAASQPAINIDETDKDKQLQ